MWSSVLRHQRKRAWSKLRSGAKAYSGENIVGRCSRPSCQQQQHDEPPEALQPRALLGWAIMTYVAALRGVQVEVSRALEQRHDAGEERLVHRVAVDEVHAVADPGETAEEGGEVRGGARQAAQLQPRICTQPSAATRCAAAFVRVGADRTVIEEARVFVERRNRGAASYSVCFEQDRRRRVWECAQHRESSARLEWRRESACDARQAQRRCSCRAGSRRTRSRRGRAPPWRACRRRSPRSHRAAPAAPARSSNRLMMRTASTMRMLEEQRLSESVGHHLARSSTGRRTSRLSLSV